MGIVKAYLDKYPEKRETTRTILLRPHSLKR